MASTSSSSGNMALPRANGSKYDVFLSFRGEDTRHSFTDHLYNALKQAGILTFRDSDDAERGEELKEEIEKAIKASDASIIVLSGNYATSTWCLDELSLILDQRRDCNHFVLPVFYHVDPSNVGKQKGSFEIQADSSKRRWTDDNVERWKAALTEVVGVIGMTLVGSETRFIKEVVDTIYNKLDRKQIHIPANITGMDVRYEEINSLLKQSKAQFLVICGMAGSGKSTLAKYIVYSEGQQFESNSIVEKIGSRCKNPHDMVVLQEQLCSDISKGKQDRRINTVCKGTAHIEVLLEKTKALIVLDEIVEEQHLEELLGSGNINIESKIIITTNNDISNWFMSKSKRFQKYIMRLLNDDEALELLSLHAFRSKLPKDGYTGLAQQVVRYCGGNPLALEVLGSSLSKNDTITSWESELSSFEKSFHDRMYEVFIRSYNSLPSSSEKELFLHIACFFVGNDMSYVVKILEPDYAAESKIKNLTRRCFLYVTPDNKLMMHRLLQDMGRSLVDRESRIISRRTRVWRNKDSYEILRRKKSSNTIEGLALDIQTMMKEDGFESRHQKELSTDSLQRMDQLKLLKLNFVKLIGSYEHLSEHLKWLCWVGFSETTIHTDLFMGNMVALDMSYSCLKEFEPPMVLPSLKLLSLKDSHNLTVISNIDQIPNLETLILWNCDSLVHVCETIGNLGRLALLNMTGCTNLFKVEKTNASVELEASTSGGERTKEPSFPLPHTLQQVYLNECNLECTHYFPLSFSDQLFLQYINLGNGLFEILPTYNNLNNLRVLDLRNCSKLKRLLCLPSTLAELYIYDCVSIEKITFESGQFTLQEFGYEGCVILSEIEGLVKLLLLAKLDEVDLGHMIWLKEYQYHEVLLVGDYELTKGRSCYLQMLYEFNIMSTSLPDINHPNLTPEYRSQSTLLSFDVPACPRGSRLKGLTVTFRYTIFGDDWVWFAKIRSTNGVDVMYSPKAFGKPGIDQIGIWLSYWPIGNLLDVGDEVNVSIVVMSGLEVLECGVSLVYTDDDVAPEILKNETGWVETFGRELSGFQLKSGSYYLCQRDIYKIMEIGRLTPGWLSNLVGDHIDDTEVRGWRMTGRPQQSYQSFTELKTGRYVISDPGMEGIYKNAEISDSSLVDKTLGISSSILGETMQWGTESVYGDSEKEVVDISKESEIMEPTSSELGKSTTKREKVTKLSREGNPADHREKKAALTEQQQHQGEECVKLFVGQVPKHMTESQLIAIFEEFALVDEVNIIKDKATRSSRGCCFVICPNREEADKAVEAFHNKRTLIGASSPLQLKYADGELERLEHKLFIGMLPNNVSEGEVSALLSQYGTLKDLQILGGSQQTSKGCAFVKYETKDQAVAAIEGLNGKHKMEGSTVPLVVKWADTEKERQARKAQKAQSVDPSLFGALPVGYMPPYNSYGYQAGGTYGLMPPYSPNQANALQRGSPRNFAVLPTVYMGSPYPAVPRLQYPFAYPGGMRPFSGPFSPIPPAGGSAADHIEGPPGANLFIYHIPQEFGDEELANAFQSFGRVLSSKVFIDKATGVSKCFGFVSYDSPAAAESAINTMNGYQLGGKKLKVQLKRDDKQNKAY